MGSASKTMDIYLEPIQKSTATAW